MIVINSNNAGDKVFLTDFSQAVANVLPDFFIARQTKYSLFQGLAASYGAIFEDYINIVKDSANPYKIIHSYKNEIPAYYDIILGNDWVFDNVVGTDTTVTWIQPTVIGYLEDGSSIAVDISTNNTVSNYRKMLPTRFNYNENNRLIKKKNVFSGKITKIESKISKYLVSESNLYINVLTQPKVDSTDGLLPKIVISGRDYANKIIEESIEVTHLGQFRTINKFLYIDRVVADAIDASAFTTSPNAYIQSAASAGPSSTTFTTNVAHEISVGDIVTIEGTTDYNGDHEVLSATSTTFTVAVVYTSSQTGSAVLALDGPFEIEISDYPFEQVNYPIKEIRERNFVEEKTNDPIQLWYESASDSNGSFLHTFYFEDTDPYLVLINQLKKTINKYELYDVNGTQLTDIDAILPSQYNQHLFVLGGVSGSNYLYAFDKRDELTPLFKEYYGFDDSPDAYLNVAYVGYNRKLYDTGTGQTASGSNSVTFIDAGKTWLVNELAGMSLEVGGVSYWILSNTSDTITVSTKTNSFEYLETVALAPTAYKVKYLETRVEPIMVKGKGTPVRIQIIVQHENSSEMYFDGTNVVEDGPVWISNPIYKPGQQFEFEEMVLRLPFQGNYMITFICEFKLDNSRWTTTFKNIHFVGEKKALSQFNLNQLVVAGITPIGLEYDYGDIRLVCNEEKTITAAVVGDTGAGGAATFTGSITKELGAGIIEGSVVFTCGGSTWSVDSDGKFTSFPGDALSGSVDYINGTFTLNWEPSLSPASTDITVTYNYNWTTSQVVDFKKDYMTIDFENKIIHCFEKYDYVDVQTIEEATNPTVVVGPSGFPATEDFGDGVW